MDGGGSVEAQGSSDEGGGDDDAPAPAPLPMPLTDDRLASELWVCRVMCFPQGWDPVCRDSGTYANECWAHCAASVFSPEATPHATTNTTNTNDDDDDDDDDGVGGNTNSSVVRAGGRNSNNATSAAVGGRRAPVPAAAVVHTPSTRGQCDYASERFKPTDHMCIQRCVMVARGVGGAGGGGGQFAQWRPACGEDGVTYTTACFAACSGVRSAEVRWCRFNPV